MCRVGKKIGSKIYAHKEYEEEIIPSEILSNAKERMNDFLAVPDAEFHTYTCVRFDTESNSVAFQFSPDFNRSDEPIVGDTLLIHADGVWRFTPRKSNPQIWHRKYLWVKDDYKGFDVDESKRRAELYDAHLTKYDKSRIGYLSYWNRFKKRVGIE